MTPTTIICIVFFLVYLGMAVGRVPSLNIDRTGIALLGLIALLGTQSMTLAAAGAAVDVPTLALLFALMIVSAQFEQAGFYAWVAEQIARRAQHPKSLLAVLIVATALLSAILTNDVVVFALTPPICIALRTMGGDSRPYLIALAGAANAGSAVTLIGNPQNILIGQVSGLAFWHYAALAVVPTLFALAAIYAVVSWQWQFAATKTNTVPSEASLNRIQFAKGGVAIVLLAVLFLTPLPREISALCVAGGLLVSRRLSSRTMIGAVDWHLLLLFTCLFAITAAFEQTGVATDWLNWLAGQGLGLDRLKTLVPLTLVGSNTIGNVPAVVLITTLMPGLSQGALAAVAMLSTFSGNLLLTGSMCNIIVAELAAAQGIRLSFADFAKSGILMTLPAIAFATGWIWLLGLAPL